MGCVETEFIVKENPYTFRISNTIFIFLSEQWYMSLYKEIYDALKVYLKLYAESKHSFYTSRFSYVLLFFSWYVWISGSDLKYSDYIIVFTALEESVVTYRLQVDPQFLSKLFHPFPYSFT